MRATARSARSIARFSPLLSDLGPNVAEFDLRALHAALDAERRRRTLSWAALARELGMGASTLRGLGGRPSAEGDGVLRMLAWLGVPAARFVRQARA